MQISENMHAWLRFFRVVNLPTVPGDVLVGAAAAFAGVVLSHAGALAFSPRTLAAAALASCAIYLFGLADNDIVGAATDDSERPIPAGEISLRAARLARGLCLFAALAAGAAANLPPAWWVASFLLAVSIVVYNRTKWSAVMGLCRGLNIACGGAAVCTTGVGGTLWGVGTAALVWTVYIALVTRYSAGEAADPAKRRAVGILIGALVYLQLMALFVYYWLVPSLVTRNLLLVGAGLLVLLRLMKRAFPKVSAS